MTGINTCSPRIVSQEMVSRWTAATGVASVIQDGRSNEDTKPSCNGLRTLCKTCQKVVFVIFAK